MIFVFGSNLAGIHGAGAAKSALKYWGAIWGQGIGRTGNSFAIPTKDENIQSLPLETVAEHVNQFIDYAKIYPGESFQVTCVGCGLAGFTNEQMAPLFSLAPNANCFFDLKWRPIFESLGKEFEYWGSF